MAITNSEPVTTYNIYLTSESRVVEANTYPPNRGDKITYRYVDADKDGRIDYALLTGGQAPRALITRECRESNLYPKIFGDIKGWQKAIVGDSPRVQEQFRAVLSSARETYQEFETALKENRVESRGPETSVFDVHDARGNHLFEVRIEDYPKSDGQLEVGKITILRHNESVIVNDTDLVRPLQAKLDELRHPNDPKPQHRADRVGNPHAHHEGSRLTGQRHSHTIPQSSRHVTNR